MPDLLKFSNNRKETNDTKKQETGSKIHALTKHIEQVKSISSLTESKSSQKRDGFPSFSMREHPSKSAGAFLELTLDSLKFM